MSAGETAVPFRRPWSLALPRVAVSGTHIVLGGIVLLGFLLRLAWVLYTDTLPLGGDPSWYFGVARNLYEGKGYVADHLVYTDNPIQDQPTAFWPPAYPVLLASLWKTVGFSLTSAKVANAVMGALAIPFIYGIAAATFSRRAGLLAAGIFAVFPNGIAWLPLLFPEAMFVLLFVAGLWLLVTFEPPSTKAAVGIAVAFGVVAGVASLTRGQGLALPVIAAIFWLMRDGWRTGLRNTAVAGIAAAAVIAPWSVRNMVVLDSPVLISTNSGVSLRTGHAPDATGTSKWTSDRCDGVSAEQSPYRPDWETMGYNCWTNRALAYALTHPARELELTRYKIYHLWRSDSGVIPWVTTLGVTPIEPKGLQDHLWRVFDVSYYALLFAGVGSMLLWLRGDARRRLPLVIVLVWTGFHIIFNGEPRYHVPMYPVLAIAAAGGVVTVAGAARRIPELEGIRREGTKHAHGDHTHGDPSFVAMNKRFYLCEEDYDLVEVTDSKRPESLFHRGRERMLARLIAKHGTAPYVDAGCGTGLMLRRLPAGALGIDINPRNLPKARRNAPGAALAQGDIDAMPVRPATAGTVVMAEVLEHLPNAEDVVAGVHRMLRPGGVFVGSVPSQSLVWGLRFLSGSPAGEPYHKNYAKDELRALLERHFDDVRVGVGNRTLSVWFVARK